MSDRLKKATKLLREPLVHFLLLGALLFLVFGLSGGGGDERPDRIVVTAETVDRLAALWTRTWQRPPTEAELKGIIDDHVKEEVFYREALALGLDRNDIVIRRRLRQKMEFFGDDIGDSVEPTEDELRQYLLDHADDFRIPARVAFDQIYIDRDRRGDTARSHAGHLLARLGKDNPGSEPSVPGDPLPLPHAFDLTRDDEIDRLFGPGFAAQLAELPLERWAGPIESSYGLHLARVRDRSPAEMPELDDARRSVLREWTAARRKQIREKIYQALRERYTVEINLPEPTGDAATPTVSGAGQ